MDLWTTVPGVHSHRLDVHSSRGQLTLGDEIAALLVVGFCECCGVAEYGRFFGDSVV